MAAMASAFGAVIRWRNSVRRSPAPARERVWRGRPRVRCRRTGSTSSSTRPIRRRWGDGGGQPRGSVIVNDDLEEFEIRPAPDQIPGLLFARVPEGNSSEVRAAHRVDVGQARIAVLFVAPSYKGER